MSAGANTLPFPIYGAPFRVFFPVQDNTGAVITGATGLAGKVSKDSGTAASTTNTPAEIATTSGMYYLDLTGTEMTADAVMVIVTSTSTNATATPITLYPRRLPSIRTGTAQAGADGTITLDSGASAVNGFYNGCYVQITNNTPTGVQGETRVITGYTGSSKVAAIAPNWATDPTSSSTFAILIPEVSAVVGWAGAQVLDPAVSGSQAVDLQTIKGQAVTAASGVTFPSSIGTSTLGGTAQTGDSYAVVTNGTYGLSALQTLIAALPSASAIWNALTSGMTTTGSIGLKLKNWVLGSDNKAALTTDATDLSATLHVDAKTLNGAVPNNLGGTAQSGDSYNILKLGGAGDAAAIKTGVAAIPTTPLLATNYTAPDNTDIAAIKTTIGTAGAGLTGLPAVTLAASQPNYAPAKVSDLGTVQSGDTFAIVRPGGTGDLAALTTALSDLITTIGASCSGVATAVWGASTRTLSSFTALTSALVTALWTGKTLPTLGSDSKVLISTDAQDLHTTLTVNGGSSGGSGLTAQQTRDAMKLAPSSGTPATGSLDALIEAIPTNPNTTAPDNTDIQNIYNLVKAGGAGDVAAIKTGVAAIPTNPNTTTPPTAEAIAEAVGAASPADVVAAANVLSGIISDLPVPPSAADIRVEMDANSAKLSTAATQATDAVEAVAALTIPSAVAIREEIDEHSTQLQAIAAAVGGGNAGFSITEATHDVNGVALGPVLDSNDVAIVGAAVEVYADSDTMLSTPLYRGTTDGDGGFSIPVPTGATYRIRPIVPQITFDTNRVTV